MSNMADYYRALTYAEMREQNMFTDAVIKSSSGREWPVHKVVICRVGRYFSNAFSRWFTETLHLGVSDDVVQVIIDMAYMGMCRVNAENVLEVLSAAFMYQLKSLIEICVTFVLNNMISAKHVLALKVFVRDHQVEMQTCMDGSLEPIVDRTMRRSFADVSDGVYELSVEDLEAYIKEDDLNIAEEELLYFVLNYIKFHQLKTLKANQLLANVRLGLVDPTKLAQIADENPTFRTKMEARGEVNGADLPRYPRDIVLVTGDGGTEIFNIRKNKWKQIQINGLSPDIILGNILYEIQFLNDGVTKIKSFDFKNGHCMAVKRSQLPSDLEIDDIEVLAWKGGILASMIHNSSWSAAYYNIDTNIWVPFPARIYTARVVVDGNLFSIGGYDEDDDDENRLSKNIEYFDTGTMSWILCGYLKKNPESLKVQAVDGKVYVFSLEEKYAECFQPVWENGRMHLIWFPNIQLPVGNFNMQISALDNKIVFTGGIQFDAEDLDERQVHIFSPRSGEWSRAADLLGSYTFGHAAITIKMSEFEVDRIRQLCNGQIVVSDDAQKVL